MGILLIAIILAFYWLILETDYLRVRLLVGVIAPPVELERLNWDACQARYGWLKLSTGVESPLCGWDWLQNNTHPIPQVKVSFSSGGVRYNWDIKDPIILKDAITATHAKPKPVKAYKPKRNKLGGLVVTLPAKAR